MGTTMGTIAHVVLYGRTTLLGYCGAKILS